MSDERFRRALRAAGFSPHSDGEAWDTPGGCHYVGTDTMRALCEAYAADEWQPIETAPEGGPLLGLGRSRLRGWQTRPMVRADDGWECLISGMLFQPTHWRPLPEPPHD